MKSRKLYSILRNNARMRQLLDDIRRQSQLLGQLREQTPSALRNHLSGLRFARNRLTLFVDAPVWATQLRLLAPELLKSFQASQPDILGIDIRVRFDISRKTPKKQKKSISTTSAAIIARTAESLEDPKLADALRRLSQHQPNPE